MCALQTENKLVRIHDTRMCSGNGGTAPLILNLGTICRSVILRPLAALPTVKIPQCPWVEDWAPQSIRTNFGGGINPYLRPDSNPVSSSPYPSRSTDYVIKFYINDFSMLWVTNLVTERNFEILSGDFKTVLIFVTERNSKEINHTLVVFHLTARANLVI